MVARKLLPMQPVSTFCVSSKGCSPPHLSRKRTRFGPGPEIDERARAAAVAQRDFGRTDSEFYE